MLHFCLYKPCAMCLSLPHFQPCAGSEPDCNCGLSNKYTYMQLRSPSLCKFRYVSWFTMAQYSIHVLKHRRCSIHSYTQMHSYTHTLHTNTHTHTHTHTLHTHRTRHTHTHHHHHPPPPLVSHPKDSQETNTPAPLYRPLL